MTAIGVISGVGPFAGLDLLRKIAEQTKATIDQEHLRVLSISDPGPIPDRTAYLSGLDRQNPAIPILEQLEQLRQMGASVAGIPCNTAHAPAIFDVIEDGLPEGLLLLHMIKETAAWIRRHRPDLDRIGVLSSTGTARAQIYPKYLAEVGLTAMSPDAEIQERHIQPAIYHREYGIKAKGSHSLQARDALLLGVQHLRDRGAEAVISGCTEIPLVITETEIMGLPVLDPTLILARALIRKVDPERLRQS